MLSVDLIIALMLGALLIIACYGLIVMGYGKWLLLYLAVLTGLCWRAWAVGDD